MARATKEPSHSKNWYRDRYQYVLVQRKILVLITSLSLVASLVTVVVIAQLTPLKTVEPFVIQVDQKTGITQTVNQMTVKEITANEAVNNFFIVQYIRARENYVSADLSRNYNIVRLMSESNKVYGEFTRSANPNNPRSNAARLGVTGVRTIKFKSITYLNPQTVQARVLVEEKSESNLAQQHLIILLSFAYVNMALTLEERYLNPLGFIVTDYRVDEDTLQK
jgi:type IV secretion system protein VirB8